MKRLNIRVSKRQKKIIQIFLTLFILLLFYIAVNAAGIWRYADTDEKRPVDVIIILGAGTYDKELSPVFRKRMNHGIWLYKKGYARKYPVCKEIDGSGKLPDRHDC